MLSSCSDDRSDGPRALPAIMPSDERPTASPNSSVAAVLVGAEQEGEVEQHESDAARRSSIATDASCRPGRRQLEALAPTVRGPAATTARGSRSRRDQRDAEQERAVDQRRRAAERDLQQPGRDHGDHAGDAGDQAELRVGLDQLALGAHHGRHERRLRHAVRLLQHERREHEREQRAARRRTASSAAARTMRAAATACTTNRRPPRTRSIAGPDQRGDDQERGEADQQEREHLAAGPVRVDVEEERVGEGDHHRRLAAHHRRVGDRQRLELRCRSQPSEPDGAPMLRALVLVAETADRDDPCRHRRIVLDLARAGA